jgi:predicted ester cyclase
MPGMPDIGKRDFVDQNQVIWQAFSNWKFTLDNVKASGDQVTVQLHVTGTHTKPLALPMPGMPPIQPTGKNISVPDRIMITVKGDKVTAMRFESPADGGPGALLGQLGVQPPPG